MDRSLGLAQEVRVWREIQGMHHSRYRIFIVLTVVNISRLSLYLSPCKATHSKEACISPRLFLSADAFLALPDYMRVYASLRVQWMSVTLFSDPSSQ